MLNAIITDRELITQHQQRLDNHPYSAISKAPKGRPATSQEGLHISDLVYIKSDGDQSRDRYLVVSISGEWCAVTKFVGTQLRASSYKIRLDKYFIVPPVSDMLPYVLLHSGESDDDESLHPDPPKTSVIPMELIAPEEHHNITPSEPVSDVHLEVLPAEHNNDTMGVALAPPLEVQGTCPSESGRPKRHHVVPNTYDSFIMY